MYGRYVRKQSLGNYLLLNVMFGLGLMAKPMLVTVPLCFYCSIIGRWAVCINQPDARPGRKPSWLRVICEKLPLLVLAGASSVATLMAQAGAHWDPSSTYRSISRINNALVSLVIYLRQFVWPAEFGGVLSIPA